MLHDFVFLHRSLKYDSVEIDDFKKYKKSFAIIFHHLLGEVVEILVIANNLEALTDLKEKYFSSSSHFSRRRLVS